MFINVIFTKALIGYDFQNIENGKGYKLILYVKSTDSVNINVALTNSDGSQSIATANIV